MKSLFDLWSKRGSLGGGGESNDYPQSYYHLISQESIPCCLVQHGTLYQPTQHAMMVNTARRVFHTHMESLPLYCKNTEIVAYPQSELYQMIIDTTDYCDELEDIVDSPVFEDCKLKYKGVWYTYTGNSITDFSKNTVVTDNRTYLNRETSEIKKSPLYAVRRQAVLRAMDYFRLPASIRDIARAINRTAWRSVIKEDDVEEIIWTIPEIEYIEGKYILRK